MLFVFLCFIFSAYSATYDEDDPSLKDLGASLQSVHLGGEPRATSFAALHGEMHTGYPADSCDSFIAVKTPAKTRIHRTGYPADSSDSFTRIGDYAGSYGPFISVTTQRPSASLIPVNKKNSSEHKAPPSALQADVNASQGSHCPQGEQCQKKTQGPHLNTRTFKH